MTPAYLRRPGIRALWSAGIAVALIAAWALPAAAEAEKLHIGSPGMIITNGSTVEFTVTYTCSPSLPNPEVSVKITQSGLQSDDPHGIEHYPTTDAELTLYKPVCDEQPHDAVVGLQAKIGLVDGGHPLQSTRFVPGKADVIVKLSQDKTYKHMRSKGDVYFTTAKVDVRRSHKKVKLENGDPDKQNELVTEQRDRYNELYERAVCGDAQHDRSHSRGCKKVLAKILEVTGEQS